MRKLLALLVLPALAIPALTGCGNGNSPIGTCFGPTSGANCPAELTPVSLSATDTPPAGVSVLSFQVQLTAASLALPLMGTPANLLPQDNGPNGASTPITIDLTQTQALSQFLAASPVNPGGYDGLNLTFANPRLVIYNASDSAIAASCPIGSICQIAPAIDGSNSLNLTWLSFQPAFTANNPLSLLIDFHLNTLLQPDFSLNLNAANGLTVSQIPNSSTSTSPQFGSITGTVLSVNTNAPQGVSTFQFLSQDNRLYTIDSSSTNTSYNNFPSSLCSTGSISCLAQGQSIRVNIGSLAAYGLLNASQVDFLQSSGQQTVDGTIIGLVASVTNIAGAPPSELTLLIHGNPSNSAGLPPGAVAHITFTGLPSYSIDSDGFTLPSGLSFSNGSSFLLGQNVQLNIVSGSLTALTGQPPSANWSAAQSVSFQANAVALEPTQFTAPISALDSTGQSLTVDGSSSSAFFPWPTSANSYNVLTTSQTTYQGTSSNNFGGLSTNDLVSLDGWLFPSPGSDTLAAQSIIVHPTGSL